jgi:hypothetical protein
MGARRGGGSEAVPSEAVPSEAVPERARGLGFAPFPAAGVSPATGVSAASARRAAEATAVPPAGFARSAAGGAASRANLGGVHRDPLALIYCRPPGVPRAGAPQFSAVSAPSEGFVWNFPRRLVTIESPWQVTDLRDPPRLQRHSRRRPSVYGHLSTATCLRPPD